MFLPSLTSSLIVCAPSASVPGVWNMYGPPLASTTGVPPSIVSAAETTAMLSVAAAAMVKPGTTVALFAGDVQVNVGAIASATPTRSDSFETEFWFALQTEPLMPQLRGVLSPHDAVWSWNERLPA